MNSHAYFAKTLTTSVIDKILTPTWPPLLRIRINSRCICDVQRAYLKFLLKFDVGVIEKFCSIVQLDDVWCHNHVGCAETVVRVLFNAAAAKAPLEFDCGIYPQTFRASKPLVLQVCFFLFSTEACTRTFLCKMRNGLLELCGNSLY